MEMKKCKTYSCVLFHGLNPNINEIPSVEEFLTELKRIYEERIFLKRFSSLFEKYEYDIEEAL